MDNAKHYDDAAIALIDMRCKSNTHRINELQEHQTSHQQCLLPKGREDLRLDRRMG